MNIQYIRDYCLNKPHTIETFPFDQNTLVFKVADKMFALVPLEKWEQGLAAISLKAKPEYSIELRAENRSVEPAFHMNKKHWNTIHLYKAELQPELILKLIDHSYTMVVQTMSKKKQKELGF
ncbi:MmcQ/YjbR family DNA-binding protein [Lacinutrix sp. MedPE-SW]|uniref:MmcQ/YjbR family DNA-binding protein n=1 Tax=Lacinutrix sp. MedPE-SW TaxID=1860087 RepID=UPI000918637F|nr:MmcQ/YjbR family DNA-binding protein [Lacinutrix sp. MedPE-SW]OIQ20333.1 MAG: MmcQ-like protein [Lacinutrix sp. MedPE-SW]